MNVLSLFDGMSCGRLALDRLGIEVDQYYAAEIDKYAIQVTQENWPETIQLGDVTQIKGKDLPKIDLILAGSPCQGFSFAGKQLAFDDPRSALFFEFVRILKECNPKYFLLENVKMKKEFLDIITQQVGAEPILINSALVSAQNRQRYYWTNIPGVEQPENRGIVLRDILETNPDSYTLMSDKFSKRQEGRSCLVDMNKEKASNLSAMEYVKNGRQGDYLACDDTGIPKDLSDDVSNLPEKSSVIKSNYYKSSKANFENDKSKGGKFSATGIPQTTQDKPIKVGMNVEEVKVRKHEVDIPSLQYLLREMKVESKKTNKQIAEETNQPITKVEHWFRTDSSFAIPSDDVWFKLKEVLGIHTEVFDKPIMEFEYRDGVYETKQRVYSDKGKSPTLTAGNKEQYIETHDTPKVVGGAWRGRYYKDGVRQDQFGSVAGETTQILELRKDGKTNSLTTVQKDNVVVTDKPNQINPSKKASGKQPYMQDRVFHVDGKSHALTREFASRTNVGTNELPLPEEDTGERIVVDEEKKQLIIKEATNKGFTVIEDGDCFDITHFDSKTRRGRSMKYKCNALTAGSYNYMRYEHPKDESSDVYWRKLTPIECERLQTVPDNYTASVSNTQRYKMLGNGWTIEVIAHILKNMKTIEEGGEVPKSKGQQGFDF
jgi:DNA-cytosine methyltransferase